MERDAEIYLAKAAESLLTAESEFDHGRYNSCANRCYYACFQAAISAMLREGIRSSSDQWPHTFVQSVFVGQMINRRHRYPSALRASLGELQLLRQRADYETDWITRAEASRGLRRCREFVAAIQQTGGERR
jgi:uncharacterized protein (UPF0332 family)